MSEKQGLTVGQKTSPLFPLPEINIYINHSALPQDGTTQHQATEQGIFWGFLIRSVDNPCQAARTALGKQDPGLL